jgi:hypothetical protein
MAGRTKADDEDQDWYRAVGSLAYRAEDLRDVTGTYVGTVFLEALVNNPDNQVIYGRRGTGKTHLLRRVEDELLARFDELKQVPVYIDGATLEGSIGPHDDPAAVALSLYVELVKRTTTELSRLIRERICPGWLEKLFHGPKREALEGAQYSADQLTSLLSHGTVRTLPIGDATSEIQDLDEAVSKLRAAAGINASVGLVDPRRVGVRLEAAAEKELKRTSTNITTRKIGGETYLPFANVAQLMREMLAALDDAGLVILFDEWSAVGGAEVQPLLAQLLRLTFRSRMSVKIASIPGRTWLLRHVSSSDSGTLQRIGFEVGDDITADVDLDSVVFVDQDIKQLATFFTVLLQRHLSAHLPILGQLTETQFAKYLLNKRIFDVRVLTELIHASAAVPRDFINLFRQATLKQLAAREDRVVTSHVRAAALAAYESKRTNLATNRQEVLRALGRIYTRIVGGQKSYLFLLDSAETTHPIIVELYTAKLIHHFPATWQDPNSYRSYTYFQVDYGTMVSTLKVMTDRLGMKTLITGVVFSHFLLRKNISLLDVALDRLSEQMGLEPERDPASLVIEVSHLLDD